MPELLQKINLLLGCKGVNFPGVKVKNRRMSLPVNSFKRPLYEPIGIEPQVSSTGHGNVLAQNSHRGERKLDELPAVVQIYGKGISGQT